LHANTGGVISRLPSTPPGTEPIGSAHNEETIMNAVQTRYRLSCPALWPAAIVHAEDGASTR